MNVLDNLLFKVIRDTDSYDYKYNQFKNDFSNNVKNNQLDRIELYYKDKLILLLDHIQTVSNHPDYSFKDTIKPGPFQIKCFVEPRSFHGQIHGIINTTDLDNQKINEYSMQIDNGYQKGRWLIHDKYSYAKERDLNNAYSGSCFMMSSKSLELLNEKFKELGIKKDDIINGKLESA